MILFFPIRFCFFYSLLFVERFFFISPNTPIPGRNMQISNAKCSASVYWFPEERPTKKKGMEWKKDTTGANACSVAKRFFFLGVLAPCYSFFPAFSECEPTIILIAIVKKLVRKSTTHSRWPELFLCCWNFCHSYPQNEIVCVFPTG